MADKNNKIKVPFKLRFKTWWEGYDLEDVKQRILEHEEQQDAMSEEEKLVEQEITRSTRRDPAGLEGEISTLPWDKLRMEMTQLIWGVGYCGPGGRKHIETMSRLLTLNSKMSALIVGAGLGGPTRVLAEEYGAWVTGFELSEELAEQAMQLSVDAGLASKAIIKPLDADSDTPFDRKYDRAFSKEALYFFPDKAKIIQNIYDTLKDGALFLITDYTLSDLASLENPDVRKWLKQEAIHPFPVTSEKMKSVLESVGFTIRVNEDVSEEYVEMIEKSWAKASIVAKDLATKGAVEMLSYALKDELRPEGIRVTLLRSGGSTGGFVQDWDPEDARRALARWQEMGFLDFVGIPMPPEAIAECVVHAATCPPGASIDFLEIRSDTPFPRPPGDS